MAGDRNHASLAVTDMNRLEVLLAARTIPLTLDDVNFHLDETGGKWQVHEESDEKSIYQMFWSKGIWEAV